MNTYEHKGWAKLSTLGLPSVHGDVYFHKSELTLAQNLL